MSEINGSPAPAVAVAEPSVEEKQIAELKSRLEETEKKLQLSQTQNVIRDARQPQGRALSTGQDDTMRARLIASSGGVARWYSLSVDQRLMSMGQPPALPSELDEARKLFGRGSDSLAASQLAKANPSKYRRLRLISYEIGA